MVFEEDDNELADAFLIKRKIVETSDGPVHHRSEVPLVQESPMLPAQSFTHSGDIPALDSMLEANDDLASQTKRVSSGFKFSTYRNNCLLESSGVYGAIYGPWR